MQGFETSWDRTMFVLGMQVRRYTIFLLGNLLKINQCLVYWYPLKGYKNQQLEFQGLFQLADRKGWTAIQPLKFLLQQVLKQWFHCRWYPIQKLGYPRGHLPPPLKNTVSEACNSNASSGKNWRRCRSNKHSPRTRGMKRSTKWVSKWYQDKMSINDRLMGWSTS